jgi:hypothetical protein
LLDLNHAVRFNHDRRLEREGGFMEIDFVDIKIIGLEEEMTVLSPDHPPLRQVFLRLSQTPPPIWRTYFDDLRKISRHPRWRRAWIDRKFIVIECVPEEIETHHLNDLKQDIAQANQRCRHYFELQTQGERHKERADHRVRERLRDMKGRLNFD